MIRPPRAAALLGVLLAGPAFLAGSAFLVACDPDQAGSGPASSTSTPTVTPAQTTVTPAPTVTHGRTTPARSTPTGPVPAGATRAVAASSCPLLEQSLAQDTIGMRLGRITVLRNRGKTTGCRLYALQGSSLTTSEHLPGPNQPAIEITTSRYLSVVAAHNAAVRTGRKGTNQQPAGIGRGVTATCFQTTFDPRDHGADWACAFSKGTTLVLVRTVVTSPALNAVLLAKAILPVV